ncbi:flagellar hook capping protein [Brevundimonas sp. AJA228-03]|uniref:flagellar hook assembly protein FlgD n=1 Tax=Brevundimonas sp. AJA228-03 TaxID=2752515 RepID=UPI001AE05506|nr:flagellar hook capping FlgD N-terminal domain-containing protein [Brevundimonas sp. AJA228-03]QTN19019.1 flagellar hook capping protein [Brevundimonas sp. AJA228-03]
MVAAITATDAASRTTAARTSLTSNFETFLSLLTSQLKNQDPLSPLDSNEFTQQLTQMSGVEQQLLTNDLLTSLLAAQQGGLGGASDYIGKDATAVWSATRLEGGKANWSYELGASASEASLSVIDSSGKTVWTGPAPNRASGTHDFVWNGKTTAGGQLPDGGVYSLKVTARSGTNDVQTQVLTRGTVTGVEMADGKPYLTVGAALVPLSSVIGLKERPAT